PAHAIVGGTLANPHDYPYFGLVRSSHGGGLTRICGGAWIAPNRALTAAHCVQGFDAAQVGFELVPASDVLVDPEYKQDTLVHDLALINTVRPDGAGHTIVVGAPWHPAAYADNYPATIMGIGLKAANGDQDGFRVAQTVIRSDAYMNDIFDPWWRFDAWDDP